MERSENKTYGFGTIIKNLKSNIRSYTMIIALLVIWCILAILTEGIFFMPRNLSMLVRQTAGTAVMALGMLRVSVTGNIDLSGGSTMGLLGGIAACCQVWYELPVVPTVLIVIFFGIVIGAWHGLLIAYLKIPAFIATLGSHLALRGVLLGLTKSVTIAPMSDAFKNIGQGYVVSWLGWTIAIVFSLIALYAIIKDRQSKVKYGFVVPNWGVTLLKCAGIVAIIMAFMVIMSNYRGVPIPVLILLGLAVLVAFLTTKTRFGRSVYAIGCNQEAADLSGINTRKVIFYVYIIEGIMCGISGIILTARLNAGASSAGQNAEMDAIASCVIGGASLSGGLGSVLGAVIGALIMTSLDNGMSLLNTENFWQYIVKGMILVAAVYIDIITKKKSA